MEKKSKANETRPAKKPRELIASLELKIPEEGKKLTRETKGDCKTIVDWVNGAKLKTMESTVATTQNLLREWWVEGFD